TDNTVTFYINGEPLETVSGNVDLVPNTDDTYRIGEAFGGQLDEVAVYGRTLRDEEIYDLANPVVNWPQFVSVRYRHASGAVWPHLDPDGLALYLPLDEPVGSTEFEDFSIYGRNAACQETQCPLAGGQTPATDGGFSTNAWGNTPDFDGEDDYLSIPQVLDPAATDFTASIRFYVEDLSQDRHLLMQEDGSGTGHTWLMVRSNGTLRTFLGGGALDHPTQVSTNSWHQAAVTYNGATLSLYLDGDPISTTASPEANDGAMLVGVNKTNRNYFDGQIDEIAIFDRALTATEIGYLQVKPWSLGFYDELSILSTPNILREWQHEVPEGLEGPYKIDLLTREYVSSSSGIVPAVWTGEIDTLAPRVELAYALSADKSNVTISCAAADYNLSEEGWECPVDVANRSSHNKDAEWFTTVFSDTEKLAGYTTASEVFTPGFNLHVTACDMWGQCTTLAPEDTDGDLIPDTVEGQGDRDGDGILDAHDYDPDGHFYELGTGKLVPGGTISVNGPGAVSIDPDGDLGYYDWTTDGTPGLYVMTVTPPEGYVVSPDCPAQEGAITPSGDAPLFLGSSEVAATKTLADGSCAANPYYLQFNLAEGEPFVFNNNIPLEKTDSTGAEGQEHRIFLPIIGKLAQITAQASQPALPATQPESAAQSQVSTTAAERIFLPIVAKQ
ncbi:MAG TPA: hypothetical protein P5121_20270, partial [Caldilineaceae bacterium]|nr:hypothetical protein [Caldilineaceae bacterium]